MKKFLLVLMSVIAFSLSAPVFAAVDLNKATQAELEGVKGIGPKKAQAIIEYRSKNGPFKTVDDLDKVTGFGKKTVDKVKAEVTVGGAAPAPAKADKPMKDAKAAAPAPAAKDKAKK
ncbi:MAG: helix-hairpin-helix domain-containing protein [Methylophilales bacterium]|nr:helix-hairpin-helix domain-containing protein [Methylophilales bacterium]